MKILLAFCLIAVAYSKLIAQNLEKGKISGEAFIEYFYNIERDSAFSKLPNTALKGAKDFNGFQFRRITFTYDYDFSSRFISRVRFEGNQSSAVGNTVNVFMKDLSLRWKNIFDGSDLIFGLQPTPTFEVSESYWQFRSLERTIIDLREIATPRDMGIALSGKFDNDGMFGYALMFANNSSLAGETDKYKRAYANLNIAPMKNMNITLYSDYKFRSKITESNSLNQSAVSLNNDVITSAAFIGIKDDDFSCGIEGFVQMTRNGYSTLNGNQINFNNMNGFGISVFGNYEIVEAISLLGRFDYYDPNSKVKFDSRNFIAAGLSFIADKNIRIIPNVLIETYEKNKNTYDPSITARVTVHFIY
jgi:hypothetical protein